MLGLLPPRPLPALLCMALGELAIAFSDVVIDGVVVQLSRGEDQAASGALQSLCWGSQVTLPPRMPRLHGREARLHPSARDTRSLVFTGAGAIKNCGLSGTVCLGAQANGICCRQWECWRAPTRAGGWWAALVRSRCCASWPSSRCSCAPPPASSGRSGAARMRPQTCQARAHLGACSVMAPLGAATRCACMECPWKGMLVTGTCMCGRKREGRGQGHRGAARRAGSGRGGCAAAAWRAGRSPGAVAAPEGAAADAVAGRAHAGHPAAGAVCLHVAGVAEGCSRQRPPCCAGPVFRMCRCCVQAAPNPQGSMFFYYTNKLAFTPEFVGRIKLLDGVAQLLGTCSTCPACVHGSVDGGAP